MENIMTEKHNDDWILKLTNFGKSLNYNDPSSLAKDIVGSAHFIAPEMLNKEYDYKCDVWSCGIIMYILISGQPPFDGETDEDILTKVNNDEVRYRDPVWREKGGISE